MPPKTQTHTEQTAPAFQNSVGDLVNAHLCQRNHTALNGASDTMSKKNSPHPAYFLAYVHQPAPKQTKFQGTINPLPSSAFELKVCHPDPVRHMRRNRKFQDADRDGEKPEHKWEARRVLTSRQVGATSIATLCKCCERAFMRDRYTHGVFGRRGG